MIYLLTFIVVQTLKLMTKPSMVNLCIFGHNNHPNKTPLLLFISLNRQTIRNKLLVYTRIIRNKFLVYTRIIRNKLLVYTRNIRNKLLVYTWNIRNKFLVYTRIIRNKFLVYTSLGLTTFVL